MAWKYNATHQISDSSPRKQTRAELTKIIDHGEKSSSKEQRKQHGAEDIAVLEQAGGQCPLVALPKLNTDEDGNHDRGATEETDDPRVAPRVGSAAPLKGEQQADDGRDEDGGAVQIQLAEAGHETLLDGVARVAVDLDEEEGDDHGHAADGQVDVKAPPPSDVLREDTSEKGTGNRRDSPHASDETEGERASFKGHSTMLAGCGVREAGTGGYRIVHTGEGEDNNGSGKETCCTDLLDTMIISSPSALGVEQHC